MFGPGGESLVLGIDPGVSRCGYGVVRRDGSRFRAVAYGVIRTPPQDELPDRLATLLHELDALIEEYRPSALAVERVLFQVNTRTAMSVGQASGLALALAGRAGVQRGQRARGHERPVADAADLHQHLAGGGALDDRAPHRPDHRAPSFASAAAIASSSFDDRAVTTAPWAASGARHQ